MERYKEPLLPLWEEQAKQLIPAYMFVEAWYTWDGWDLPLDAHNRLEGKRGVCSSCGGVQFWRTDEVKKKGIRHGASVKCPECGRTCEVIASAKMPKRRRLEGDMRCVFCLGHPGGEAVSVHAYYINFWFPEGETEPELEWQEDARYELMQGEFRCWKWEAETVMAPSRAWHFGWRFVQHGNAIEPWPNISQYGEARGYTIFTDGLEGTFLRGMPLDEIGGWRWYKLRGMYAGEDRTCPWCKLLCAAAQYPEIEILAKRGIREPVIEMVLEKRKNARYLNWEAERPLGFLRLPEADAKAALGGDFDFEAVKIAHDCGVRFDEAKKWSDARFTADGLREWKRCGDDPAKVARYLCRQGLTGNDLHLLTDYRDAAELLGRDLTVPSIRFPKDLRRAHDEATASAEIIRYEIRGKKKSKANEEYAKKLLPMLRSRYEWQSGEYIAMVPERLADIALEGSLQKHCVGGYIDRHAEGKLTIMFIRRVMCPMMPLWTAELAPNGELTQIQGYHNYRENRPAGKDREWVDRWLKEIQRRRRKGERTAVNG